MIQESPWMFHCHQIKELQGLLWNTLVLYYLSRQAELLSHWWIFFVRHRSKIWMRCSSILLQRHGNLWGSSAFVVIDFVYFLLICLWIAKHPNIWLRPQAVLRVFLFWFFRDVCLWFWCWAFLIFLSVGCGWSNSIRNQVWGSLYVV